MSPERTASWQDYLKSLPLYLLPHHAISRLTLRLTRIRTRWFKNAFIRWFAKHYEVNREEALYQQEEDFEHFNAFFTRQLAPGVTSARSVTSMTTSCSRPRATFSAQANCWVVMPRQPVCSVTAVS